MLIYCESILGRTVFVSPYKSWIDSSSINQYVDRRFLLESHLVMMQHFNDADSFITLKNRYSNNQLDKTWIRGTMLHRLEDTPFNLATLYCGNELRSPSRNITPYKYITVEPKPIEQIEEYLRCMDEIYNYL